MAFGAALEQQQAVVSRQHDSSEGKNRLNFDVALQGFDLHVEGIQLLTDTNLKLMAGRRYGLLGDNGIGKSTLLRHLAARQIPGVWPEHMKVTYVAEEEDDASDAALTILEFMAQKDGAADDGEADDGEADGTRVARCCKLLAGLGLRVVEGGPVSPATRMGALSGGQRVTVHLAKALVEQPHLLLLDEPSNHLDVEGVIWLTELLTQYPGTVVVASHDLDLLNDVATDIAVFSRARRALLQYAGNYDAYRKAALEDMAKKENFAKWETSRRAQLEAEIEHLEKQVGTGTVGDRKAGSMISSRRKALDRLGAQRLESGKRFKQSYHGARVSYSAMLEAEDAARTDPFSFQFRTDKRVHALDDGGAPLLALTGAGYSYPTAAPRPAAHADPTADTVAISGVNKWGKKKAAHAPPPPPPVLSGVDMAVFPREKIGIVGRNGSGKTTLLRLLAGDVAPSAGEYGTPGLEAVRIGHYTQGHVLRLNPDVSAFDHMQGLHPGATAEQVWNQLGAFGLPPSVAELPMRVLSSGQRVRVAFASEGFARPSVLLLDEPTNHLDVEAQVALLDALQSPKLTCVVVSHSEAVLRCCSHIYVAEGGTVRLWDGSFAEYKEKMLEAMAAEEPPVKEKKKKEVKKDVVPEEGGAPQPGPYRAVARGAGEAPPEAAAATTATGAKKWVAASAHQKARGGGAAADAAPPKPAAGGVKCRLCGGPHFSSGCEKKKKLEAEYNAREAKRQTKREEEEQQRQAFLAANPLPQDGGGAWSTATGSRRKK